MSSVPLVILHKQLGDVLLLEPALAKLAAATGGDVVLATRPGFAPLLELMPHVRPLPEGLFRRASMVVSFDPRLRACIQTLTTSAAAKHLIVMREDKLHPLQRLVFSKRRAVYEGPTYRALYYYQTMPVPDAVPFRPPRLASPPADWLPPGLPDRYVVLHTTSAWPSKSWGSSEWAAVLDKLHAAGVGPFVITGGTEAWERDYVNALQARARTPLIDLCGKTSLRGYLAVIARADMVLCIDGSASHLAAAFGKPVLTLFGGPTHTPQWHYPTETSVRIDARSFSQERKPPLACIPVEPVYDAALTLAQAIRPQAPAEFSRANDSAPYPDNVMP